MSHSGQKQLLVATVVSVAAAFCLGQGPGLVGEYYPGSIDPAGDPLFRKVGEPRLQGQRPLAGVLSSPRIFSVRWHGWLWVETRGDYTFAVRSTGDAVLSVAGERIGIQGEGRSRRQKATLTLERGLRPIEVTYSQRVGRNRLLIEWAPSGEPLRRLEPEVLVPHRPVRLRAWLIRKVPLAGSQWRWLGVVLGGVAFLAFQTSRIGDSMSKRLRVESPWLVVTLVLAAGLVTAVVAYPFTSPTGDGDDVRYMDAALFDKAMAWNMNRYAHIYSLKACLWFADGDVFRASRLHWSILLAITVASMVIVVRCREPGARMAAFAIALFLMLSQADLFGGIGLAYADYSAMMFVTAGVALYLWGHGPRSTRVDSLWPAVLLGAVTVAAVKSKETGLVLLWLLPLLAWSEGRFDSRGFRGRLCGWLTGAAGAYLLLMSLDALVLGDFWFSLRPESFAGVSRLQAAAVERWDLDRWVWLAVVWKSPALRFLGLLALAAPLVAVARRQRLEHCLFLSMPLAYLAMMIAIHPPIESSRYLFPILPAACLVATWLVVDLAVGSRGRGRSRSGRWLAAAVGLALLFGPAFEHNLISLDRRLVRQRGERILYPWRQFEPRIVESRPRRIHVSRGLYSRYGMFGRHITRERIARLYFHRRHLRIESHSQLPPVRGLAIVGRREAEQLDAASRAPAQIVKDSSGEVVLLLGSD